MTSADAPAATYDSRPEAEDAARRLVRERYPDAVQAWLAGSVVRGDATATSDLDVTVLLDEGRVHRESLLYAGWPVELFVHTAASIEHYVAKDRARRRPTMARLVASGVPLVDGDAGADVRRHCEQAIEAGPGALSEADLLMTRYGLTDLLDDLVDPRPAAEAAAVAVEVWQQTADLALAAAQHWTGSGKWRARELRDLDESGGTHLAEALDLGLRRALAGEPGSLATVALDVLGRSGGRLWAGFDLDADLPTEG